MSTLERFSGTIAGGAAGALAGGTASVKFGAFLGPQFVTILIPLGIAGGTFTGCVSGYYTVIKTDKIMNAIDQTANAAETTTSILQDGKKFVIITLGTGSLLYLSRAMLKDSSPDDGIGLITAISALIGISGTVITKPKKPQPQSITQRVWNFATSPFST